MKVAVVHTIETSREAAREALVDSYDAPEALGDVVVLTHQDDHGDMHSFLLHGDEVEVEDYDA